MQTSADRAFTGKLTGGTRRDFIRGIAAAGASTATAVALDRVGVDRPVRRRGARARPRPQRLQRLRRDRGRAATAPTSSSRGATSSAARQARLPLRLQQRLPGLLPLKGDHEGLLFVNHEYPDPFYLHGYKPNGGAKTPAQVQEEQDTVGNSILHITRNRDGEWKVVSPSVYNRCIYGDRPDLQFTGPLRGDTHFATTSRRTSRSPRTERSSSR
jgi:uncharacterized protein